MADVAESVYCSVLVVRCQAGDGAAFEELLGLHQPRLRYFLRRVVEDDHIADDLLQEVWLEVYRGIARLARPQAFVAWLYQIARRRAHVYLRKRQPVFTSIDDAELPDDDREDEFSPEDAERVHAGLKRLAPEHREVLLLRFIEGMDYADIAHVVGCRLGTVRSRIHFAKRALRRTMEAMAEHE